MIVSQIVAVAQNGVIGKDNDLVWNLPDDLNFFKETTKGHHIIMGRKNYESIGRALPHRTNVIITRNTDFTAENCIVVHSLEEALDVAVSNEEQEAFVIGGGEIYRMAMPISDRIYYTEIKGEYDGDTYYPELDSSWKEVSRVPHPADERHAVPFSFVTYERN